MAGETDLQRLLATMQATLNPGSYVFCQADDLSGVDKGHVIGMFQEAEGMTLIVRREYADAQGWAYDYVAAWITLRVHSSLAAVGLTAAFSTALAGAGISCNVVAALHHDHLFVAEADAERALAVLHDLAGSA
jgi:hypothetical protein